MRTASRTTFVAALIATQVATAGGFDTPVLYSARHMGMGGTGVSWVYDPTALYMNPAGIGNTEFITLHLDLSPIIASIEAIPEKDTEAKAGPAVLVPFLFGSSFRIWKYLTFGIGAYPVASASGGYKYDSKLSKDADGTPLEVTDETTIRFIEISPALAFNYKDILNVGVGYRLTLAQLKRFKETEGATSPFFDFDASGWDFAGVRAGIQYRPIKYFSVGVNYRHKIEPVAEADSGTLIAAVEDIKYPLVLPSRLSFGFRADVPLPIGSLGISTDAEYGFQSQNDTSVATYVLGGKESSLNVPFKWKDAWTVRWGAELSFLESWAARVGFVWDQETSNRSFSSAFGTPPADTWSYTLGGGYKAKSWEVNLAYAYRSGGTTITQEDVDARDPDGKDGPEKAITCLTCSFPGEHQIALHGIYVDFSWYFDMPSAIANWSRTAD